MNSSFRRMTIINISTREETEVLPEQNRVFGDALQTISHADFWHCMIFLMNFRVGDMMTSLRHNGTFDTYKFSKTTFSNLQSCFPSVMQQY
jgi:hypothetical protein